jgi:hypothetical protein
MAHRLAVVVVGLAALAVSACAPPSPPTGYVPCAIERPAPGGARLPTHLVGLPDTVDDLWGGSWLSAELPVALPPSDIAVRARLQMDERGRVVAACLLDPLDTALRVALLRRILDSVSLEPAAPPTAGGSPWIEDRVVWLRRARPLEAVLGGQPLSGSTGAAPEVRALSDRAAFLELGRLGSPESLAAYERIEAALINTRPRLAGPGLRGSGADWAEWYPLRIFQLPPVPVTSALLAVDADVPWPDSDSDGRDDSDEWRLGLDPANPDSDGDGLIDGIDACPTLPLSAARNDPDARIAATAFIAAFGSPWSSSLLIPTVKMPRVHFGGYGGAVLYGGPDSLVKRGDAGYFEWEIVNRTRTGAAVKFRAAGRMRFESSVVYLVLRGTRWYAVAVDGKY